MQEYSLTNMFFESVICLLIGFRERQFSLVGAIPWSRHVVFIVTGISFVAASMAMGIGTQWLDKTFRWITTVEVIEPVAFNQSVAGFMIPLLEGWCGVFFGIMLVITVADVSRPVSPTPSSLVVGWTSACIVWFCGVVFLLASILRHVSVRDLDVFFPNEVSTHRPQ